MADKFRVTYPINVTFGNGEQPSASKLNSINNQAKNGLALVERALGDPWNQSGDSLMVDSPLQIPTLARAIGEQKHLNARLLKPNMGPTDTILIQQSIVNEVGDTRIKLDFKPTYTYNDTGDPLNVALDGMGYDNAGQQFKDEVTTNTSFYVDTLTGVITLGSPLAGTGTLTYTVQGQNLSSDAEDSAAFNVIPDPDQLSGQWDGIKIVQRAAGKYLLVLPPRRPTNALSGGLAKVPSNGGGINTCIVGDTNEYYWYFSTGTNAGEWGDSGNPPASPISGDGDRFANFVINPKYRYQLSEVLETFITTQAAGSSLPSGSVLLWDDINKTVIEGITFRIPEVDDLYAYGWASTPGWVLQVEGSTLDAVFAGYTSSDNTDDPADYRSDFSIIVIGNSLASAVSDLRYKAITNRFDISSVSKPIRHYDLVNLQPANADRGYLALPTPYRANDDHPDYLSRNGSTTTGTNTRDRFNNAMLGDLLMGSTSSTSNYQNITANSRKIVFGELATGPAIYNRHGDPVSIAIRNATVLSYEDWLAIERKPIYASQGVIAFGTGASDNEFFPGNFNGIVHNDQPNCFKFVGDNDANLSKITAGELFILGSTHSISTSRASNNDWTGYNDTDWVQVASNGSTNLIRFKGQDLDISADTGDASDVVVGLTNASTNLVVSNDLIVQNSAYLENRSLLFNTYSATAANQRALVQDGAGRNLNHYDGNGNYLTFATGDLLLGKDGTSVYSSETVTLSVTNGATPRLNVRKTGGDPANLSVDTGAMIAGTYILTGSPFTKMVSLPTTASEGDAFFHPVPYVAGSSSPAGVYGLSKYRFQVSSVHTNESIRIPMPYFPESVDILSVGMWYELDTPNTVRWRPIIKTLSSGGTAWGTLTSGIGPYTTDHTAGSHHKVSTYSSYPTPAEDRVHALEIEFEFDSGVDNTARNLWLRAVWIKYRWSNLNL